VGGTQIQANVGIAIGSATTMTVSTIAKTGIGNCKQIMQNLNAGNNG